MMTVKDCCKKIKGTKCFYVASWIEMRLGHLALDEFKKMETDEIISRTTTEEALDAFIMEEKIDYDDIFQFYLARPEYVSVAQMMGLCTEFCDEHRQMLMGVVAFYREEFNKEALEVIQTIKSAC